jgi:hypothetical protein
MPKADYKASINRWINEPADTAGGPKPYKNLLFIWNPWLKEL